MNETPHPSTDSGAGSGTQTEPPYPDDPGHGYDVGPDAGYVPPRTPYEAEALRIPPHSTQAEQSLLGALMQGGSAWERVADQVGEGDFYRREHRVIFGAIKSLTEQDEPCDLVTLAETLERRQTLDDAGGLPYLGRLVQGTASVSNIEAYARIVRYHSVLRQLIAAGTDIADLAYNPKDRKPAELLDEAESKVFAIAEQLARGGGGFTHVKPLLVKAIERIDQLHNSNNAITGLPTGFADFDEKTSGLQNSDLIIVAGRPSMGKCCAADTRILQADGSLQTIEAICRAQQADLFTLGEDWRFHRTRPSHFVDDGLKPVFRVTTRLGRRVETTLPHPFLTLDGWRPLAELGPGERIAVPRTLPVFGTERLRECEVKLLGYLLGDGSLTGTQIHFTNNNPRVQQDFIAAAEEFGGLRARLREQPGRATDISIAADADLVRRSRHGFSRRLALALAEAGLTQRGFALAVGASPASVSYWVQGRQAPGAGLLERIDAVLGGLVSDWRVQSRAPIGKNGPNPLAQWLTDLGLRGCDAHGKTVPELVFRLTRPLVALFLNRLFATDGWISTLASGQVQVGYASVSEALARDVQHLLLRFGIVAALKERRVKYQGTERRAWQLDVTDARSIQGFLSEIGAHGKDEAIAKAQEALASRRYQTNRDLIPLAIWDTLAGAKGDEGWASLARRAGLAGHSNIHAGRRCLSRDRLVAIAGALGREDLTRLAQADVYWDEIVAIEPLGLKQVYDLTIPDTHNFVAEDVCVHNTSFAMNLAENVAIETQRPVAVFSMEMPGDSLAMRMMSSLGRIDQHRVRTGKLEEDEWPRLTSAVNMLSKTKIYIDDTPALSPTEVRARARRLKREQGDLALIVLDYLQLMQAPDVKENRVAEISAISRSLKALAKELDIPVIALSQLNRSLEQRPNKRPVMSDLRESGAIEQDADIIVFIYRDEVYHEDSKDKGIAEIIIAKQRNGPIGTTRLTFLGKYTKFENFVDNYYGDPG